jgi:catechol 2,3-dioxygenase-like lactoylglutathione lyase family enzyme
VIVVKNIVPMLASNDLRKTIEFYTGKLGFKLVGQQPPGPDPAWCYLEKSDSPQAAMMFNVHRPWSVSNGLTRTTARILPWDRMTIGNSEPRSSRCCNGSRLFSVVRFPDTTYAADWAMRR